MPKKYSFIVATRYPPVHSSSGLLLSLPSSYHKVGNDRFISFLFYTSEDDFSRRSRALDFNVL